MQHACNVRGTCNMHAHMHASSIHAYVKHTCNDRAVDSALRSPEWSNITCYDSHDGVGRELCYFERVTCCDVDGRLIFHVDPQSPPPPHLRDSVNAGVEHYNRSHSIVQPIIVTHEPYRGPFCVPVNIWTFVFGHAHTQYTHAHAMHARNARPQYMPAHNTRSLRSQCTATVLAHSAPTQGHPCKASTQCTHRET